MRLVFQVILMFILGNCTLAENIQKEEGKDYGDTYIPNPIEHHDSATLQRLEEFYYTDFIDYEYLNTIYKGKLKHRNVESVKLHWEKARELALTEWKLQKDEMNWVSYSLSIRPRLLLDENNKDFYRYYEFFVLDGEIIKGSILIPTYKKTENFFTAEVRVYDRNQVDFESYSTKWGEFAASQFSKIKIEKDSNVDLAFNEIYDTILDVNKITEYDIYYKQISEELTNSNLLPVQGHVVSNLIYEDIITRYSNDMTKAYMIKMGRWRQSGGGGGGSGGAAGSGGNSTSYIFSYNHQASQERLAEYQKAEAIQGENTAEVVQKEKFGVVRDEINNTIAKKIADDNFEKTRLARRNEFLAKTKIAYEESTYIWHTNFLVEMGNNTAQKNIADGYSIILWNELENETSVETRSPILVGAGVSALIAGIGNITYQISSGKTWNNLDIHSIIEDAVLAGVIGGKLGVGIFTDIVRDAIFTVVGAVIGGSINHIDPDNPNLEIGTSIMANMLSMFSGSKGNAIFHITVALRTAIKKAGEIISKQIAKKELKEEAIPVGRKIEMGNNPRRGSGGSGKLSETPSDQYKNPSSGGSTGSGGGNGNLPGQGGSVSGGSGNQCSNSNHNPNNTSGHNYN